MNAGMLWFDDSKRTLPEKVKIAATQFQKKYGRTPDLCLVNPNMMTEASDVVPHYGVDIHVRPYRPVLPGHLWIGIDEEPEYVTSASRSSQEVERAEMTEIKKAEMQA